MNNLEYIAANLSEEDILCQIAEEAVELAQAALKLRRAISQTNPAPITVGEADDRGGGGMMPELKHALEVIRRECEKHRNCAGCPFCSSKDYRCWIMGALHPDDWEPDEWEKENANDNQNDMA